MRDALFETGNVSAAVNDTVAYSENVLDLLTSSVMEGDLYVCFQHTGAAVAADSYIFHVDTSDDSGFATYDRYTFPQTETNVTQGKVFRYRAPADIKRYVRTAVTPKSSGTFTAATVRTWFELGQREW